MDPKVCNDKYVRHYEIIMWLNRVKHINTYHTLNYSYLTTDIFT